MNFVQLSDSQSSPGNKLHSGEYRSIFVCADSSKYCVLLNKESKLASIP